MIFIVKLDTDVALGSHWLHANANAMPYGPEITEFHPKDSIIVAFTLANCSNLRVLLPFLTVVRPCTIPFSVTPRVSDGQQLDLPHLNATEQGVRMVRHQSVLPAVRGVQAQGYGMISFIGFKQLLPHEVLVTHTLDLLEDFAVLSGIIPILMWSLADVSICPTSGNAQSQTIPLSCLSGDPALFKTFNELLKVECHHSDISYVFLVLLLPKWR